MPTNYEALVKRKNGSVVWDEFDDDMIDIIKPKKLFIELPAVLHMEIKSRSSARGISLKKYVLRSIIDRIKREKKEEVIDE